MVVYLIKWQGNKLNVILPYIDIVKTLNFI